MIISLKKRVKQTGCLFEIAVTAQLPTSMKKKKLFLIILHELTFISSTSLGRIS